MFRRKPLMVGLSGLSFIAASCSSLQALPTVVVAPPSTETSAPQATVPPTSSATPPPTVADTSTPVPTATLEPSSTPLPITTLHQSGILWFLVHQYRDNPYFSSLDLSSGITKRIAIPANCKVKESLDVPKVICQSQQRLYILDVLSGATQDLPIEEPQWLATTTNKEFLLYGYRDPAVTQGPTTAFSLDTYNLIKTKLAVIPDDLYALPALSSDGRRLAFTAYVKSQGTRVFEILRGAEQARQIGPEFPAATPEMSWSPTAPQLIYGATDIDSEIGFLTNYVNLYDANTGKVRLLAKAPKGSYFERVSDPSIWSPDGRQVAIPMQNSLCIISINDNNQACNTIVPETYRIFTSAWSPDSSAIALGIGNPGSLSTYEVMIYQLSIHKLASLLNLDDYELFWER